LDLVKNATWENVREREREIMTLAGAAFAIGCSINCKETTTSQRKKILNN